MKRIGPRPWTLPLAAALLTLALALGVLAAQLTGGSGGASSSAAPLATACDNFARASELFAKGGSVESLTMTGGHVFTRDAQADSKEILRELMDACAAERLAPR